MNIPATFNISPRSTVLLGTSFSGHTHRVLGVTLNSVSFGGGCEWRQVVPCVPAWLGCTLSHLSHSRAGMISLPPPPPVRFFVYCITFAGAPFDFFSRQPHATKLQPFIQESWQPGCCANGERHPSHPGHLRNKEIPTTTSLCPSPEKTLY